MRLVASLAVIAATTLGYSPLRAQAPEGEVTAVVRRLFDAMRASDSAGVRAVFHPQGRMLIAGVRSGRPALAVDNVLENFVKSVGSPHADKWDERIEQSLVRIDGSLAMAWVDYTFYLGERFSHCGIDHFLLSRVESGEWKIVELAYTRRTEGCPTRPS